MLNLTVPSKDTQPERLRETRESLAKPNKTLQFAVLFAIPALLIGARVLHADDRFFWRSWGARDGFAETYSYAVSVSPSGSAYIRHGAVLSMSVFDGYRVLHIPDPRGSSRPDWPSNKRVYAAPDGALWTASLDAIKEYRYGKWTVEFTAPPGHQAV